MISIVSRNQDQITIQFLIAVILHFVETKFEFVEIEIEIEIEIEFGTSPPPGFKICRIVIIIIVMLQI